MYLSVKIDFIISKYFLSFTYVGGFMKDFIHSKNAICFSIALLIFLCLFILLKVGLIYYLDTAFYQMLSYIISEPLNIFFIFITTLGGEYFLIGVTAFLLIFFRKRKLSIWIALNLSIAFLLNISLKTLIARPRPPISNMILEIGGYSFPSGHSMCSMAFFGTIIYFISLYLKPSKLKKLLLILIPIIVVLIGISRIYLGAHYFSDVLSGFSLSIAILSVFSYFYKKRRV